MSNLTRRQFMRRGACLAAGLAAPSWALWLGEQMDRLRPRRTHVVVARPQRGPLVPIRLPDGRVVEFRDWTHSELYDTIVIPAAVAEYQDFAFAR